MKKKPDLSSFQRPALVKDPSAFLDDAVADRAEKPAAEPSKPAPKPAAPATVAKLFRLSSEVAAAIKRDAAEQSIAAGKRVTEAEIIEQMARDHYDLG